MEAEALFSSPSSEKSDKKAEKTVVIWCVPDLGDEWEGVEMS